MFEKKECCGTCKYHEYEDTDSSWICVCEDSDYYSDWTAYGCKCDEYERRSE